MDMASLKGLLRQSKPTPGDYVRSLQTVLAGISRYTVDGRDDELALFRETLLRLSSEVKEQSNTPEVEKTVGIALEHLRDYNDRANRFNSDHLGELKSVMRTMTETITFLSESRTRSVHQLQYVEREMEQAAQMDDIKQLRARLITCLDVVREETVRLQTETQVAPGVASMQITRSTKPVEFPNRFGSMDGVTGLPTRKVAEQSIIDALEAGQESAVALFVVNRMPGINARYGREIGDEVMLRVSNHFAQHLSSTTSLYRWSGPALLALAEVNDDFEDLKRSWIKTASTKHELSLDSEERSVFVMVDTSVNFYPLQAGASVQELFRMLDHAVAGFIDAEVQ